MSDDFNVLPLPELVNRRTTSDNIADALRDAILTGAFEDGAELNQVALAKHFGVSRVPIREALRQLQAEGLVSAQAHLRTVVTGLTVERVGEILDVRALLEGYLLGKALEHQTPDYVERLRGLCEEMDSIDDHPAWLKKNREFHQSLYAPARASLTSDLVEQLAKRVERYLHLWSSGEGVHRNREANAEHWAIVKAVERHDARRAVLELDLHISHTRERVVELFRATAERTSASASASG